MGSARLTEERKREFYSLIDAGVSITRAAQQAGIGKTSAFALAKGKTPMEYVAPRREREAPDPKTLEELGTDARSALGDINQFAEMFLARRPSHWRYEAAMRVGELLASPDREFIDVNLYPGIGKSTFWGCDLPLWLIAGGFFEDPQYGRALRIMLGASTMKVSRDYLNVLRRLLDLKRPFYDKEQAVYATHTLALEYGRFKPDTSQGDESIWTRDQFLVAQLADVDLYQKEATVQAAARDSGFLGERVNLAIWDDIAIVKNASNSEIAEDLANWFEDECETRVEPGGLLALVGQRLSPIDLHRKRLDARVENEDGEQVPLYKHLTFPAHHDRLCDGTHRQWVPEKDEGCLTDAWRLGEGDWRKAKSKANYRTVFQQEDADPSRILVQPIWLEGGTDPVSGFEAPGCYDRDRGFLEWPTGVGRLVDYVAVDPSVSGYWVATWWAVQPESRHSYLIEGRRARMQAKDLLDWNNATQAFSGWIHKMTVKSYELGHPIRCWIIEANAAHKYLWQFEHFRRWRSAFPNVQFRAHTTGQNKADAVMGVEGLLPTRYMSGLKHLPKKQGMEALNFLRAFEKELTTYPFAETDDCVMADWIGEHNLDHIIRVGRRDIGSSPKVTDQNLPGYLRRQSRTHSMEQPGEGRQG